MPTFTITNRIKIPYIDKDFDDFIYDSLTITNPVWLKNRRMNYYNRGIPKKLYFYDEIGKEDLYVPKGFFPDITEYLKDNNIEYKINNQTHIYDPPLNSKFSGILYPFQKTAAKVMLSEDIGTLCAPTGSGKTVIGIYLIIERKQPTLIIIHTKELLYQWIQRIKQFSNINDQQIGKIGDGYLDENKDITVALIQTLKDYPKIINQYGHLIVDECHRIPSKTFTKTVSKFSGRYITGLSATPYRGDGLTKVIKWYTGKILHKIEPRDLIKKGYITGIQFTIRKTDFVSTLEIPSAEYPALLQELSQDEERNKMIVNDIIEAANIGKTCLVLSDRKAHCYELKEMLSTKCDIPTEILTGNVSTKSRKQIVKQVNNGKIKILIATGQLIGEGFDCKNLSALFLTLPIRYHGRIIQSIGRVLRPMKGKDCALIYDYFDHNIKCLYGSFKARKKEYEKLEVY